MAVYERNNSNRTRDPVTEHNSRVQPFVKESPISSEILLIQKTKPKPRPRSSMWRSPAGTPKQFQLCYLETSHSTGQNNYPLKCFPTRQGTGVKQDNRFTGTGPRERTMGPVAIDEVRDIWGKVKCPMATVVQITGQRPGIKLRIWESCRPRRQQGCQGEQVHSQRMTRQKD